MFAVRIETVDGTTLCRVHGVADATSAPALRESLSTVANDRRVVVDLSGVPFIDSAGLGCLIAGARRVHGADGEVVLCSARRSVNRLLHTAGMDRLLPIVDSVSAAIALLDEPRVATTG